MQLPCTKCGLRRQHARKLCRSCYNAWLLETNPEYKARQHANARDWHARNPDKVRDNIRRYRNTPGVSRSKTAKSYGLTEEEYVALVSEPCGLCGETDKPRYCDHDHATGIVRGALCHGCNLAVGFIEKRGAEWVERALTWMRLPRSA